MPGNGWGSRRDGRALKGTLYPNERHMYPAPDFEALREEDRRITESLGRNFKDSHKERRDGSRRS